MKIEIETEDGRKIEVRVGSHFYLRKADGRDAYWDWEHFGARSDEFEPVFQDARELLERLERLLPDLSTAAMP